MTIRKFSDIFKFASKSKIKAGDGMDDGTFPFYTSSSILKKRFDKAIYFEEALILGTGGNASIHHSEEPFSTSTDCLVAYSKDPSINIKYVYYYLIGNIYLLELGFKGAGIKHISKSYIENIEIPILTIEEQNRIVEILNKINVVIKKRRESIKLTERLLRSVFIDIFGDPILNRKNWEIDNLGNIAELERGRFSPRPRNDPSYFNGNYPFVQTGDISSSNYRLKAYSQTLNERGIKVSKKFNTGDILIAIVGATIGATAILEIDVYATDSIIGIKAKKSVNNVFLEMLLRFYRQYLLDTAPSAARANINLSILEKLKIITPPTKLQEKYLQINHEVEGQFARLEHSLTKLLELRNSLSQKLFKGQLNFDIDFELDALIQEIDLDKKVNDLGGIAGDVAYLQRMIDKLNGQGFKEKNLYDKAKHAAFQLLSIEGENKVLQTYNEKTKTIELTLR